jgi:outer membrane protein assembly factor BamB
MAPTLSLLIAATFAVANTASANWLDFRGPKFDGHAPAGVSLPLQWSETNNMAWKTAIPDKGWSTPVVFGKQIWLTTATEDGRDYFALCVDADSGKIVFNERLFHTETPEPLGNKLNSYASPSPVIEAGRVYVHFGSYGTACIDTSRFKLLWKRDNLPCKHFRGPGSSPALFNDVLILTMDGIDVQYLVALDKKSGQTIWKTNRTANWNDIEADGQPRAGGDFRKAYSTPLIVDFNGAQQMITVGSKAAYAHDPQTGRELWKLDHAGFSPAARPVSDGTNVVISTGNGKAEMIAVRLGGTGSLTETNILWRNSRGTPRMPSPVIVGELLFLLSDGGIATCLEAATGKELWQERLGGEYAASLLSAGDRIYYFSQDGKATVLKAARTFEIAAVSRLDGGFMASPAVLGHTFILRTRTHLYRIEDKAGR